MFTRFSVVASTLAALTLAWAAHAQSFSNPAPINIPDSGAGGIYPSTVIVSGVSTPAASVRVTLNGLTHSYFSDLAIVLVAPNGRAYSLTNRCGGAAPITDGTFSFSVDAASSIASNIVVPGVYLPSSCTAGVSLPPPAPSDPYSTDLAEQLIADMNGNWLLYLADLAAGDSGVLAGGWTIDITTTPTPSTSSTTAFTYQGKLKDGAAPMHGPANLRFKLFDAPTGGSAVGSPFASNVAVNEGLFSVLLDFGLTPIDAGAGRWLEIAVNGTILSPRQRLSPSPTAIEAKSAIVADTALLAENTRGISVDASNRVGVNGPAVAGALLQISGGPNALVPDQQQFNTQGVTNGDSIIWQSFTPSFTGLLRGVTAGATSTGGPIPCTFRVYAGEGIGGALLAQQSFTVAGGPVFTYTLTNAVPVTAGQLYTFSVVPDAGLLHTEYGLGNPYPGGRCSNFAGNDLMFQTMMIRQEPALYVGENGYIGMGTKTPAAALHIDTAGVGTNWQLRLKNSLIPGFESGLRASDTGFLEATQQVGGANFARLSAAGSWSAVSDRRLKTNITPGRGYLNAVDRLNPVDFQWLGAGPQGKFDFGLIAQDVQGVLPNLVIGDERKELLTVNYAQLSVVAIGAIKELRVSQDQRLTELQSELREKQKKIDQLESDMQQLRQRLDAIEGRVLQR